MSNAFLSCSADWSIRLWNQDKPQPIMTFLSSTVRCMIAKGNPISAIHVFITWSVIQSKPRDVREHIRMSNATKFQNRRRNKYSDLMILRCQCTGGTPCLKKIFFPFFYFLLFSYLAITSHHDTQFPSRFSGVNGGLLVLTSTTTGNLLVHRKRVS